MIVKKSCLLTIALGVALNCGMAVITPRNCCARVLSGGVTERKVNRKIASMLKTARKNRDAGRIQIALENYWKILELDPNENLAYFELGEIYVKLKIYDRAIELLEPGLESAQQELDSDTDTLCYYYCILTRAYQATKQLGKANRSLLKAAEASPRNPMPREILGDIYLANNRVSSAMKAYKKALEFDSEYTSAIEKLGKLVAKYGNNPVAPTKNKRRIAKKAVKLIEKTPKPKINFAQKEIIPKPLQKSKTLIVSTKRDMPVSSRQSKDIQNHASDKDTLKDMSPISLPAQRKKDTSEIPRPMRSRQKTKETETIQKVTIIEPKESPKTNIEPDSSKADAIAGKPQIATDIPAPTREEIEMQHEKLLAGDIEAKDAAVSFFINLKEKGLIEIEELLYDPDPDVRLIAIGSLIKFTDYKKEVKTMLEDAADDPDPGVSDEIKFALKSL